MPGKSCSASPSMIPHLLTLKQQLGRRFGGGQRRPGRDSVSGSSAGAGLSGQDRLGQSLALALPHTLASLGPLRAAGTLGCPGCWAPAPAEHPAKVSLLPAAVGSEAVHSPLLLSRSVSWLRAFEQRFWALGFAEVS